MADILIRMEMPKGCAECKLNSDTICVLINGCIYDESNGSNRRPDCPLIKLPEHGDLIDADSLADDLLYDVELAERALDDTSLVGKEQEYAQSEKDIKQNCAYYVSHAPVIVPSNKEDDE